MRILIIDDDYVSRAKIKYLLSQYGDCDSAPNGQIGLMLVEEANKEGVSYDLVTVDIDMPGMRGPEVVKEIQKYEGQHAIKILMITSMETITEIASSFRSGCDWCLKKPVTPENLKASLQKIEIIK